MPSTLVNHHTNSSHTSFMLHGNQRYSRGKNKSRKIKTKVKTVQKKSSFGKQGKGFHCFHVSLSLKHNRSSTWKHKKWKQFRRTEERTKQKRRTSINDSARKQTLVMEPCIERGFQHYQLFGHQECSGVRNEEFHNEHKILQRADLLPASSKYSDKTERWQG